MVGPPKLRATARRAGRRLAGCAAALVLSAGGARAAGEPVAVFVSIPPLAYFAEQVGGERVSVSTMLAPGHSPATYEPTSRQMAALARARVYFRIGVPFERAWIDRVAARHPALVIADCRRAVAGALEADRDPHVWTSPRLAAAIAGHIRDVLSDVDPAGAAHYDAAYGRLARALEALDRELRGTLEAAGARRFMIFHPALGYFADEYGLEQKAIEHEGKPPTARQLAALIDWARANDVRTILVQRQFGDRLGRSIARATGARLAPVDPLARDYPAAMRRIADVIAGRGAAP